jgi:conjugal transfer pilus assembly protein TraA
MLKKMLARAVPFFALMTATAAAHADTINSGTTDGGFGEFAETMQDWAQGPLGVGLSIAMLIIGLAMGIARNSPMPALSGVAGAAFLSWGPGIIIRLVTGGALI